MLRTPTSTEQRLLQVVLPNIFDNETGPGTFVWSDFDLYSNYKHFIYLCLVFNCGAKHFPSGRDLGDLGCPLGIYAPSCCCGTYPDVLHRFVFKIKNKNKKNNRIHMKCLGPGDKSQGLTKTSPRKYETAKSIWKIKIIRNAAHQGRKRSGRAHHQRCGHSDTGSDRQAWRRPYTTQTLV